MTKFIFIDEGSDRVKYISDTRPTIAGGDQWIEVSNDSVAENWHYDKDTSTLSQYKPYTIKDVRLMRNDRLHRTDWMVAEDSPFHAAEESSNLTSVKAYRQALRDFPDESVSYNENNIVWPTLSLSGEKWAEIVLKINNNTLLLTLS